MQLGDRISVEKDGQVSCPQCSHPAHGDVCGYALTETIRDNVGIFAPPTGMTVTEIVGTCKCEGARIESITYTSGSAAIYRTLNHWQRLIRSLTPRRWRKSLIIRESEPPTVTINGDNQPTGYTMADLIDLGRIECPDDGIRRDTTDGTFWYHPELDVNGVHGALLDPTSNYGKPGR